MELEQILIRLTTLIENEFKITILDPNISLFSNDYQLSTLDVLYIIYSYINQYGNSISVKPNMSKYSPNEIADWLLKNER